MSKTAKWLSTALAVSMVLTAAVPAFAATDDGPVKNGPKTKAANLVDSRATDETKSMFAYLNDVRGKEILFGHQHATDEGLTLDPNSTMPQSDVKNSVGDFPAVFGWDTLSLEGKEKPGVPGDIVQSRANLIASMKQAHNLGGILTLSSHMPNFVTGGSFNDTKGDVVAHILPGGDKNAAFNAFLDNIAEFANNLKDDKGNLIPVMFRPFHEQNGGWFWWGAKTTTTSQYVEIYRYTVEYLRDKKGVHNFLYVFSPNGSFGGSEASYLTTYPGNDYVDILGMDQYDNLAAPGSQGFLTNMVNDLAMISKLADSKGKIATFSEFGYSPQGMKVSGNGDTQWFTHLLNAIKANPDAKRMAYMLTWANFGTNGNLFVPYHNAKDLGDHELLPDFINYYKDPYTAFAGDIKHDPIYNKHVTAEAEQPFMHIASPTNDAVITAPTTKIRARVLNEKPSKVVYVAGNSAAEVPMTLDEDGYYSADWSPEGSLNGKTADITVKAYMPDNTVMQQASTVFVQVPEILMKAYTFENSSETAFIQNNGTYSNVGSHDGIQTSLGYAVLGGNGMLKLNASGLQSADTWQELKLEIPAAAQTVSLPDVKRVKLKALIPAFSGQNANASLRSIVMLPPDWNTKYGMTTTEQKLSDLPTVTIDGTDYLQYSASIDLNDAQKSAAATSLAISLVGNGLAVDGPIYIDDIQLFSTYSVAPSDPAVVDDFESYEGSDAALGAKFIHAGGDATNVSLTSSNKSGGTYAMKFDYTLAGNGYAGITKVLGGVDWSEYNQLKFWLTPDGSNQKLVIQVKIDGIAFEAYPSLASPTAGWVSIPFNQFTVAPWDTGNAGKTINKINLKNVQEFSIYVNAVNGATLSSSLYFDDIKAFNDGTGGVPNGGTGPGSAPEQPGTLYGFETDTQGWDVEVNNAGATAPAISTAAAAEGTHSLSSDFNLAGDFELTKVQAADLSAVGSISAKVKLSTGTAKARLYLKTGSAWEWHDSGAPASIDSSGFTTLTIPLAGISNLDSVQSIGVKIESAGDSGTSTVYVDDVALAGK